MATRVWGAGSAMDGLLSTATCWTDDTKPQAGDDIVFNATDTTDCRVDENTADLGSLTATSAFTAALNFGTDDTDLTVAGDVTLDNSSVQWGDGAHTFGGNVDIEHVTSWNADTAVWTFTGIGKTLTTTSGKPISSIVIDTGASITIDGDLKDSNAGKTDILGQLTCNSGEIEVNKILYLRDGGSLVGTGVLIMDNGTSIGELHSGSTLDIDTFRTHGDMTFIAGSYGCALIEVIDYYGTSTILFGAGTINFSGSIDINTAVAGGLIIDAATNDPTINIAGSFTAASASGDVTVNMGDGTWTVTGDFDNKDVTTFNRNASTVVLDGVGTTLIGASSNNFNNLTISGNTTLDSATSTRIDIRGLLLVSATFTLEEDTRSTSGANLQVTGAGIITGVGELDVGNAAQISRQDGTIDCAMMTFSGGHDANIIAATYASAAVTIESTSADAITFTFASGTYNFSGDLTVSNSGVGAFTVDGAANDPTVNVSGDLTTVNSGGGTLAFNLGGDTWTVTGSFTHGAGTVNTNAGTLDVGVNLTMAAGAALDPATLPGSTILVGGDAILRGDLTAASAWTFTVGGGASASGVDVSWSDASGGSQVQAIGETDSGNNANWLFDPDGPGTVVGGRVRGQRRLGLRRAHVLSYQG